MLTMLLQKNMQSNLETLNSDTYVPYGWMMTSGEVCAVGLYGIKCFDIQIIESRRDCGKDHWIQAQIKRLRR